MEDKKIADDQITASSEWFDGVNSVYHGANNARLNRPSQPGSAGGWYAQTDDLSQWMQVDLIIIIWVTGVKTQGREDWYNAWITEYKVEYSSDGQNWMFIQSNNNRDENVSLVETEPQTKT